VPSSSEHLDQLIQRGRAFIACRLRRVASPGRAGPSAAGPDAGQGKGQIDILWCVHVVDAGTTRNPSMGIRAFYAREPCSPAIAERPWHRAMRDEVSGRADASD
jgi:hypothetical protein